MLGSCTGGAPALAGPLTFSTLVGLSQEALARVVSVFPNPTAGLVTVKLAATGARRVTLRVLDNLGRPVYEGEAADNATRQLDLHYLPAGLYPPASRP